MTQTAAEPVLDLLLVPYETLGPAAEAAVLALSLPSERARSHRLRHPEQAARQLAASVMTRAFLSHRFGHDASAWHIEHGPEGQPRIAAPASPKRHLSRSATRGMIAVAVAPFACGVDVETMIDHPTDLLVVEHFFTPTEQRRLAALPEADRRSEFFRLWTLKEAYGKALGLGLAADPAENGFRIESTSAFAAAKHETKDKATSWQFRTGLLDGGIALGLAAERSDLAIRAVMANLPTAGSAPLFTDLSNRFSGTGLEWE